MSICLFIYILRKTIKTASFNLETTELIRSIKFNASEMKEIRKLVENNKELFKNKWNEYFNS
ncbi:DUF4160 domain-containing protein [Mariniflexile sp.]|uniref:DUF4160 domain-containing protein n=1 Tax=Mariniflexile sp. TaxID=1979402 RepID=UPI00404807D8